MNHYKLLNQATPHFDPTSRTNFPEQMLSSCSQSELNPNKPLLDYCFHFFLLTLQVCNFAILCLINLVIFWLWSFLYGLAKRLLIRLTFWHFSSSIHQYFYLQGCFACYHPNRNMNLRPNNYEFKNLQKHTMLIIWNSLSNILSTAMLTNEVKQYWLWSLCCTVTNTWKNTEELKRRNSQTKKVRIRGLSRRLLIWLELIGRWLELIGR